MLGAMPGPVHSSLVDLLVGHLALVVELLREAGIVPPEFDELEFGLDRELLAHAKSARGDRGDREGRFRSRRLKAVLVSASSSLFLASSTRSRASSEGAPQVFRALTAWRRTLLALHCVSGSFAAPNELSRRTGPVARQALPTQFMTRQQHADITLPISHSVKFPPPPSLPKTHERPSLVSQLNMKFPAA